MRNSPPIHTCSEHAQGPSKPPAVVRKTVVSECAVLCATQCASPAKWQLWNKGRGKLMRGSITGKHIGCFVTLQFRGTLVEGHRWSFAYLNRVCLFLPLWAGGNLPAAARENTLISKVTCKETVECWIVFCYDSGHSQVTLEPFICPVYLHLRSLAFDGWLLTFLPCLFR